ncbi:pilus assembly protein [Massilia solisilvae]|uniref:Pilus assembly protein n=1 Tax=Massilia solisilvae TaxID=1811225 RepID=A0ABT2BN54_9BURK|nr:TadE family protein [Massilia solisilvae]MCS0609495.1 pilus assembly protein [Massilia solisilvae]
MTRQHGATLVEFSLVLVLFLTFTLGLMDFARLLFTWNAATEATRHGARYAAACVDPNGSDGELLNKMREMLPAISAYSIAWNPAGCTASTCQGVTVTITDFDFQWLAPIPDAVRPTILIPGTNFSTYLPRESLRQDPYSATFCQ